jgi:hypothetical protein
MPYFRIEKAEFDATGISMERIIGAGIFVVTAQSFVPFAPFEVGVLSGACLELK